MPPPDTWNRRSFLKASLAAGALIFFGRPDVSEARAGEGSEGRLALYNTHTDERLEIVYRDGRGRYDPAALGALNYFFRCHYTQQVAPIDPQVIEFLSRVDRRLGGGHEIHVISGYRSPEYNAMLVRQRKGAAKHSLHLQGRAVDIRIPAVGLDILKKTAQRLEYGGVGYYPKSGFIHLDSGRVRSW